MSTGARRTLRYLDEPRPIIVLADPAGRPTALVVDGRRRAVADERDDWIVEDRWWTAAPIARHYRELILAGGRLITVYRELPAGAWFAHGAAPAHPLRSPPAARTSTAELAAIERDMTSWDG